MIEPQPICGRCKAAPRAWGQSYCGPCSRAYSRAWRERRKQLGRPRSDEPAAPPAATVLVVYDYWRSRVIELEEELRRSRMRERSLVKQLHAWMNGRGTDNRELVREFEDEKTRDSMRVAESKGL